MTKCCTKCGTEKPLEDFGKDPRLKSSYGSRCRACLYAKGREWHMAHPTQYQARKTEWDSRNRDKNSARARVRYANKRERHLAVCAAWAKKNRPKVNAFFAERRAAKRAAAPKWLTAIQKAQIQEFYEVATALKTQTGIPHDVDHIIPLLGKNVRGLHVPWNLQVISAVENQRKGNALGASQ